VSEDDAHRGNNDDRSVGAFAVKPRAFGAPLCGARRGRASPTTVPPMRCSYDATRLSNNLRQIECWFSHFLIAQTLLTVLTQRAEPIRSLHTGLSAAGSPAGSVVREEFKSH